VSGFGAVVEGRHASEPGHGAEVTFAAKDNEPAPGVKISKSLAGEGKSSRPALGD